MKFWRLTVGGIFLTLCLDSGLEAAENRVVEIIYDFRKEQTGCCPQIMIDTKLEDYKCVKSNSDNNNASRGLKKHPFEIKPTDSVILIMKWQCDATAPCDTKAADIQYAVMGKAKNINILKIILESLTKLTTSKSQKAELSPRQPTVSKVNSNTCLLLLPVKDNLVAGGYLIVTLNKKESSNGSVMASSGPWSFQIGIPPSRYTVSHGFVITNAAKPNQHESTFRDDDPELRLVPSPFTFVNIQPWSGWLYKQWRIPRPYVSVGFQLGSQPFDDLVVGVTLGPEVDSVGLNCTLGGVISLGTEKDSDSEFDISHNWGLAVGVSLVF